MWIQGFCIEIHNLRNIKALGKEISEHHAYLELNIYHELYLSDIDSAIHVDVVFVEKTLFQLYHFPVGYLNRYQNPK